MQWKSCRIVASAPASRVLEDWPDTRLVDDVAGNEFKAVIPRPASPTAQVTPQVGMLLMRINGEMSWQAMQDVLGPADREHFRKAYLASALDLGLIETTLPDKPNSRSQRYRLTAIGRQWLEGHATRQAT